MNQLISSSFFNNESISNIIENSNSNHIGCVFQITQIDDCSRENIKKIKEEFNKIKENLNTYKLKKVISIDIKTFDFKDKEILFFKSLLSQFDYVMIYSYSNAMIQQLSSKKCCNMIVNVFSQEIIKKFDFIHHFNSGLNHVILQDFKKHNIALGVDIKDFSNKSEITMAKTFSSCIQNSKLATKANVPQIIIKIIENELDLNSNKGLLAIQKAFFKAQSFQIEQQKNYFSHFFNMQDKELNKEIVGYNY